MKILEKSKIVDFRNVNYICKRCNSKHSISAGDLVAERYYFVDVNDSESYFYDLIWKHDEQIGFGFYCPKCNHFNWIEDEESIPTYIRRKRTLECEIQPKSDSSYYLKATAICGFIIIGIITYSLL